MGYKDIKKINEQFLEERRAKRKAEKTALDDCQSDLSDVSFTVGKNNNAYAYMTAACISAFPLFAIIFKFINGNDKKIMGIIIAIIAILVIISIIYYEFRPRITVNGRTLSYKGKNYEDNEIAQLTLPNWGSIQVYSMGKVIAKAGYDDENYEKLVAWANKCNIYIEDKRDELQ